MARQLRSSVESDWHHIMNRGARRLPVFGDDEDREAFLRRLAGAHERVEIEFHAYALMENHFHLVVRAAQPALSEALKWTLGTYTQAFNRKYALDGPLYRSRFTSVGIHSDRQLMATVRYVHRNPVKGHWAARLSDYRWTSHLAHSGLALAPLWLATSEVASWFSSSRGYRDFIEKGSEPIYPTPARPRPHTIEPSVVEASLGVGSPSERALLQTGGRGIRNDIRQACLLLCLGYGAGSTEELAARYGLGSANSIRAMAARAASRCERDGEFAALISEARQKIDRRAEYLLRGSDPNSNN